MMTSLRGGFRSVAHGAVGAGQGRSGPRKRGRAGTVITIALLLAAVALLLRRFGVLRF